MYIHFLVFWTTREPSRTPKNHENHCTVIQIQGFANFKKITFRGRFWMPSGLLWASFWSPLRSLGLPKRFRSSKRLIKWCPEPPWAPRGSKRTPNASQDLQNGPLKLEKINKNWEKYIRPAVNFTREDRVHRYQRGRRHGRSLKICWFKKKRVDIYSERYVIERRVILTLREHS